MEPEAGLEPATTRLNGDNPILRPVEKVLYKRGEQEMASMFRTGLEPTSFDFSWNALALLSYRFDNRSATARPKEPTGKKGAGNPATLAAGAGFEPASPLGLLPITQTQRPVRKSEELRVQNAEWPIRPP